MDAVTTPHEIDGERLLADLRTLRSFGSEGTGVRRPALSEPDVAARRWLAERMDAAGLDATIDGLGTVYGRTRQPGRAVVLGSHTDTQPLGGWLDGAYGVLCGLEVARALPHVPIDVASWQDEEGAFAGFVGSRAFIGEDMSADLRDMESALRAAGWWGRPIVRGDRRQHLAYLEAHIEQGGELEATGRRLGVVTGIVGIRQRIVRFTGRRNHAGTTPMRRRADASVAMVGFLGALHDAFEAAAGPHSVWTHGRITVSPGAPSVIPDLAEVTVQYRDADAEVLTRLDAAFSACWQQRSSMSGVTIEIAADEYEVQPARMDERLVRAVTDACNDVAPGEWMTMPSGAAHDAQVISELLPSGMVFVPSMGGVSHAADEDTALDDLVLGCRALARAVLYTRQALGA